MYIFKFLDWGRNCQFPDLQRNDAEYTKKINGEISNGRSIKEKYGQEV